MEGRCEEVEDGKPISIAGLCSVVAALRSHDDFLIRPTLISRRRDWSRKTLERSWPIEGARWRRSV